MENTLIEVAKQSPALVILVWLVYKFITALRELTAAHAANSEKTQQSFNDTIGKAITVNTEALNENTHALGRVGAVLDAFQNKEKVH